MFGNFVPSIRKSRKLQQISKILGAELSVDDFIPGLGSGIGPGDKKDEALSELFDLCEADPDLRQVLANYSADRKELKAIYYSLIANGAGQWTRGHYVAASAFELTMTLEFMLRAFREERDLRHIVFELVDYFERGKVGPVE